MEKRNLGQSGLQVSVLGLGCWPLGGGWGWGDQELSESIATIHAALDLGINLFDTAEGYNDGHSEEVVGIALADRRERAVIATKVSPTNTEPATLRAHCEASLQRLQTDYIDLYQVHWPITDHSVEDAFATLKDLQAEGKIRAIGISNHGVQQMQAAFQTGAPIASNQLCYNLLSRAIETGILPLCRERNVSVIVYMALMQGLLVGKYASIDDVPEFRRRTRHFSNSRSGTRHDEAGAEKEVFESIAAIRGIAQDLGLPMAHVAMAWVAARPGIACVLAGSRTPAQVKENVAAASVKLPDEVIARLDAITEELRIKLGPNADYWQTGSNCRVQ